MPDEVVVRVEGVSKVFGSDPKTALPYISDRLTRKEIREKTGQTIGIADVSFKVCKGEILVVMGLSGSGKSTLVRCINRLIEPTAGTIFIDDDDVTAMGRKELLQLRRHKLAMVFQNFGLFPHRSVLDNARYGLEITGESDQKQREEAMNALKLVGLDGWETSYPSQLSGGMQQRVGLARALATDPEIILMDEALSALDPLIRKDMQNELIDLQRKLHKTILFITHDLDEAINMGDRIIIMKDGYVVQEGTAEEILTQPATHYVARFVEDIDKAKVLTAESVMKRAREVAHENDGPRTILHKMKDAGLSTMYAVDAHGKLKGIIRAEKAAEAIDKPGETSREELIEQAERTVSPDTPLMEVTPMMAESREPVAVVDESGKLRGVVVVGALLAGMTENGQVEETGEEDSERAVANEKETS